MRRVCCRSWLPEITIDPYTGTDFAWAWNAPLMQIGGRGGLLITSGRCVGTCLFGVLSSLALMRWPLLSTKLMSEATRQLIAKVLLGLTVGITALINALLTALTWPQSKRLPPPPPAVESELTA